MLWISSDAANLWCLTLQTQYFIYFMHFFDKMNDHLQLSLCLNRKIIKKWNSPIQKMKHSIKKATTFIWINNNIKISASKTIFNTQTNVIFKW